MRLRLATLHRLMILAVIGLAIAYLALLRPLAQRVVEDETPLHELRSQLEQAAFEAGLPRGTEFLSLSNRLNFLQATLEDFSTAEHHARPRLDLPLDLRARLEEPFQLVEFLNDSQRRLEELQALAQKAKVKLTPGLSQGFPRYQDDIARPELLWVQLAALQRVIRAAVDAQVSEVSEVSVEPLPLAEPAVDYEVSPLLPSARPEAWTALRIHLTTRGTVNALAQLLTTVALTPEEAEAVGLPRDRGGQPALFIDQLLLQRDQLEAAEQARLELVLAILVPADGPTLMP